MCIRDSIIKCFFIWIFLSGFYFKDFILFIPFSFKLKYPNSYYVGLGSLYVSPHLHFKICEEKETENLVNNLKMNVENNKNNLEQSLLEIGKLVQTALDHIQISDEELESASQQLKLFTNGTNEAIEYAEKELKGLEEGTYWARYCSGLLSRLKS